MFPFKGTLSGNGKSVEVQGQLQAEMADDGMTVLYHEGYFVPPDGEVFAEDEEYLLVCEGGKPFYRLKITRIDKSLIRFRTF